MLTIVVPARETYDSKLNRYGYIKETKLQLEHSLVSMSKWEAKWHIPFLGDTKFTAEQILDYVRCMTLTQNVDPEIYNHLTDQNLKEIFDYISAPMTATWFSGTGSDVTKGPNRETITSELIYYWMIAYNIPVEFQKWHLKRLITLIRICHIKNSPQKKKTEQETLNDYRALNEKRKAEWGTPG